MPLWYCGTLSTIIALQGELATLLVNCRRRKSIVKVTRSAVEENQVGENANKMSTTTLRAVPIIKNGRRRPMRNVT